MSDDRAQIVVRVETRNFPMRSLIAAIIEAFSASTIRADVAEVMPDDISNPEITARARSLARGAAASAYRDSLSVLNMRVALTEIRYHSRSGAYEDGSANIVMIACMGPVSPLRLAIRVDPRTEVPQHVRDLLAVLETSVVREIPDRVIASWPEGIEFADAATELLFEKLFTLGRSANENEQTLQ